MSTAPDYNTLLTHFQRLSRTYNFSRQFFAEIARIEKAAWRGNDRARLEHLRQQPEYASAFEAPEPLISVIIPTYARSQIVIERTVPSVIAQTHRNWEIIIVGDQMADEHVQRLNAIDHPRVHFHNLKQRGRYPREKGPLWYVAGIKPVNFGLRVARGQWIAHLDDDDEFLPDHLERLLATARAQRAEWAHGRVSFVDDDGREAGVVGGPQPREGGIARISSIYHGMLKTFRYNQGCWKYQSPGDWDLWDRFLAMGVRQVHLPVITAIHHGGLDRLGEATTTQKIPEPNIEQGIALYNTGQLSEAIEIFQSILETDRNNLLAHVYLAFICAKQNLVDEAGAFITRANDIAPSRHELSAALGEVFLGAGNSLLAQKYLQAAVLKNPELFAAYPSLAEAMRQNGDIEGAISLLQSGAHVRSSSQNNIYSFLFELLTQRGDIRSLERCCQQRQDMVSRSLGILLASRGPSEPKAILNGLHELEKVYLPTLRLNPTKQQESPLTTLAFLVSDLKRESALGRLEALLTHLPSEHYRTVIIDNDCNPRKVNDIGTQRMFLVTDHWIQIDTLNDTKAIEAINQLPQIDVLIDTDGVGVRHRLSMFYELMATCKASWGRLSIPNDEVLLIAGTSLEASYARYYPTSKRIQLPQLGNRTSLPEIQIQPTRSSKERRFACLTPAQCVDESSWRVFAEVLKRSTATTLMVNLGNLSHDAQSYVTQIFADEGIAPARLGFVNATSEEEICHAWNLVDIGLAPIGDSGELVLNACLWMGRPFIAFMSDAPWSGHPGILLESLGLANLIACSLEDYLEKSLALIDSPPLNGLRELVITSQPSPQELAIAFETSLQNIQ